MVITDVCELLAKSECSLIAREITPSASIGGLSNLCSEYLLTPSSRPGSATRKYARIVCNSSEDRSHETLSSFDENVCE